MPLWSTTMGQNGAMVRLLGEVTERCANVGRQRGVRTCAVSVLYGGRNYAANVLSGTVAVTMSASKRGEELLALLGSGLTEESISALLHRWSLAAAAASGRSAAPRSMDAELAALAAVDAAMGSARRRGAARSAGCSAARCPRGWRGGDVSSG